LEPLEGEGFHFNELDISDRAANDSVIDDGEFDVLINLAGRAGVRDSVVDPWVYYETNVTGTLNLLEGCRRNGVSRFVQASTSSLYRNGKIPFFEEDRPLSPYAASKKAAEAMGSIRESGGSSPFTDPQAGLT
jgi:UDP-glucuronate 4-epimerase